MNQRKRILATQCRAIRIGTFVIVGFSPDRPVTSVSPSP